MKKMISKKKSSRIKIFAVILLLLVCAFGVYYFQPDIISDLSFDHSKPKIQIIDEDSKNRAYGVMINNHNQARPYHAGLQDAYLVYEMIVEGGITRYLAFFQDQDTTKIGPIRSARPYFLDYVMEHDAYFVHWGFSDEAKSDINRFGIQNINGLYQEKYFWRDRSLPVSLEHTAFTSMEKLKQASHDFSYRNNRNQDFLFSYSASSISISEDAFFANQISIPYSKGLTTSYVYNEEEKVYKQFVNGEEHVDFVTKKPYTVKNIIVYQVSNSAIDNYGRQQLNNVSKGEGYYITEGKAIPILWSKKSREGETKYTYQDGTQLVLNDGNTWIHIEPKSQKFVIE